MFGFAMETLWTTFGETQYDLILSSTCLVLWQSKMANLIQASNPGLDQYLFSLFLNWGTESIFFPATSFPLLPMCSSISLLLAILPLISTSTLILLIAGRKCNQSRAWVKMERGRYGICSFWLKLYFEPHFFQKFHFNPKLICSFSWWSLCNYFWPHIFALFFI